MKEHKDQPQTRVEEIKQEFSSYLRSIDFGSPDYLAFCDYYAIEGQKYNRRIHLKNVAKSSISEEKLVEESQLRISEVRIAMLENQIDNCHVPGHRELFYLGKVPRHRELFCGFDL